MTHFSKHRLTLVIAIVVVVLVLGTGVAIGLRRDHNTSSVYAANRWCQGRPGASREVTVTGYFVNRLTGPHVQAGQLQVQGQLYQVNSVLGFTSVDHDHMLIVGFRSPNIRPVFAQDGMVAFEGRLQCRLASAKEGSQPNFFLPNRLISGKRVKIAPGVQPL